MRSAQYFQRLDRSSTRLTADNSEVQKMEIKGHDQTDHVWLGFTNQGSICAYFPDDLATDQQLSVSDIVEISTVSAQISGEQKIPRKYVKILCQSPDIEQTFSSFIDEIIRRHQASGLNSQSIINGVVNDWRRFLMAATREISLEVAQGLFGELSFLNLLVKHKGADSIEYWTGPKKSRHDFVGPNGSVEVKTTRFDDQYVIRISNLKQLDTSELTQLTLANLEVNIDATGQTLQDVVDELKSHGVNVETLNKLTEPMGYVDGQKLPSSFTFLVRRWRFWPVDDEFPRLTPDLIPEKWEGIFGHVSYSLSLAGLPTGADEFDMGRFF